MERTNQRTAYTLTGEGSGYNWQLEVTRHIDGSQFSMSGSMSGSDSQWWVNYSVSGETVNVSVSGPEAGAAEATAALKALADAERAANGEEA